VTIALCDLNKVVVGTGKYFSSARNMDGILVAATKALCEPSKVLYARNIMLVGSSNLAVPTKYFPPH